LVKLLGLVVVGYVLCFKLQLLNVLSDLFGEKFLQLWTNTMFCRKFSSQVIWVITFEYKDVIVLPLADFDRKRQNFASLLRHLPVGAPFDPWRSVRKLVKVLQITR
jgi:hypothetical protein